MYFRFLYFIGDKVDTKTPTFCLLWSLKRVQLGGPRSQAPYCFNIIPLLSPSSVCGFLCLFSSFSSPKFPTFPEISFSLKAPKHSLPVALRNLSMAKRPFKKEQEQEQEQECSDPYEDGEEEVEYTRKKVMIRVVSARQRMSSLVPLMSYSSDSSSSSSTSTSTCYGNIIGGSDSIGSLRCQADECGVDLKMAKTYHKRHKVCERHAKAAVVLVTGIRQRFCQQCSK